MDLLHVSGLWKKDERGFELKDIQFTQPSFRRLAIAGATGSGKTTLLKLIAGLSQPDSGTLLFEGKKIKGPNDQLIPGHPGIAYLSQQFELPHYLRVEQALEYANELSEKEASSLFEVCRISHLLKRRTDQLSGGERQRIAIARLLIGKPKLLLLDEPFSNTDMIHKNMLKSIFHYIGERLQISCIMVSHDPLDTLSWADEILVLRDGQIVQHDTPQQIYLRPVDTYVAGLFGKYTLLDTGTAAQFIKLPENSSPDKSLFLRPEAIELVASRSHAVAGTVLRVAYFGGHDEIDLLVADQQLTIRTPTGLVAAGDEVYVGIVPGNDWMI